jgi:molybdate transport system substrate-binding protein
MKKAVLAAAAAALAVLSGPGLADDLKVITGAGMTEPVRAMAEAFGKQTGTHVIVVSDTTGGVQKRLEGGEKADLVLVTTKVMDVLAKESLVAGEHSDIARVMVGVAVKKGAAEPDISSADAVKQSLLAAKSVAYVDPAVGGITGPFFAALCQKLGIADQVAAKAVLRKTGGEVAAAVANGDAELGVTLVSELLPNKGISLAGPLPTEIQIDTVYTVAFGKDAANPAAAQKFLARMQSAAGQTVIREAGLVTIAQ